MTETQKKAAVQHVKWHEQPVEQMNSLLDRQYVVCDRVMVARVLMKKGCTVPEHSHENEQIAYVESGALEFTINGKSIVVRAGELLLIPPNVPHSATALEDTVDLDYFQPPRQDWIDKHDDYLRR